MQPQSDFKYFRRSKDETVRTHKLCDMIDFKCYPSSEQAEEIAQLLFDNSIECRVIEVKPSVDITFVNSLTPEFWVQVLQKDLKLVESILDEFTQNQGKVPFDHFLRKFSDEDLIDILENFSDWDENDFNFARILLAERGKIISDAQIAKFKEAHIEQLRTQEKGKTSWIFVGYLFSILGGLIGLFIGWYYWTELKKLPNDEKIRRFDESTQNHGKTMFFIASFEILLAIGLKTIENYTDITIF